MESKKLIESKKNKPRGWIDTNDYSFEPINSTFGYLFEFGEEKARVSYIYNSRYARHSEAIYEFSEKIDKIEGNNREMQKYSLLVGLGMNLGRYHALEKAKRAASGIERSIKK